MIIGEQSQIKCHPWKWKWSSSSTIIHRPWSDANEDGVGVSTWWNRNFCVNKTSFWPLLSYRSRWWPFEAWMCIIHCSNRTKKMMMKKVNITHWECVETHYRFVWSICMLNGLRRQRRRRHLHRDESNYSVNFFGVGHMESQGKKWQNWP